MDSCVTFPKEAILICRPSLRKACGENRNAAKFLSYLLFRASIREEAKLEAQHINAVQRALGRGADQDTSITVYRTQGQIVREMDEELCDRTLRDEAIPCLVELGYLTCEEIKGDKQYTAYTIHPAVIQQGIDHPEHIPHFKTMTFYQSILETRARKKLRSENSPNRSENFPSGSEFSPQLHGENSEPNMLPQHAPQAVREAISTPPKSNKKDSKKEIQESNASSGSDAHTRALQHLPIVITTPRASFLQKGGQPVPDGETESQTGDNEAENAAPSPKAEVPPSKSSRLPCRVRQARKATTALTLEGQHILDLYQTFKGRKVVESDTTIKAANALGAVVGQDDDFLAVLGAIQADTFLNERGVRTDLDFVARKYDGYLDAVERQRRKAQLRSLPSTSLSPDTWTIPASLPTVSGRERLVVPPDIEALMASVGGGN